MILFLSYRVVVQVRTERGEDAVIVLVGNKTDLTDKRCTPPLVPPPVGAWLAV